MSGTDREHRPLPRRRPMSERRSIRRDSPMVCGPLGYSTMLPAAAGIDPAIPGCEQRNARAASRSAAAGTTKCWASKRSASTHRRTRTMPLTRADEPGVGLRAGASTARERRRQLRDDGCSADSRPMGCLRPLLELQAGRRLIGTGECARYRGFNSAAMALVELPPAAGPADAGEWDRHRGRTAGASGSLDDFVAAYRLADLRLGGRHAYTSP